MANDLNVDVSGKVVMVGKEFVSEGHDFTRLFQVNEGASAGFGAKPTLAGRAIFGRWLAGGGTERIEGWMLERVVDPAEVARLQADYLAQGGGHP